MMTLAVLLPFAGAVAAFLFNRWRAGIGLTAGGLTLLAVVELCATLLREGPQRYRIGGWEAPLGISLYADGLSAVMLAMTAIAGVLISVYARTYFRAEGGEPLARFFWPLWLMLWGGLNALYLSGDLFNLYVVLEIAGLSAVALAALSGKRDALAAAFRYLVAAMVASLAYLLGVGLLYAEWGVLDLHILGGLVRPSAATAAAFGLMLLGLAVKTALFPLHFWLPPAHSAAPAPVSAVLSALVIKGSFYLALRLWFQVFHGTVTFGAGQLLGAMGAAAILWGSFQALRQRRLKLLIAHSTVGQIGYLFLLFPLTTVAVQADGAHEWMTEAWTGGMFQALSHGFAKAAMFLAAGVILRAAGNDQLASMRDLAGRLPITTFAFALAGVSLIGLPPSGGFVAKWMLLKAIIGSGQWWWVPVVLIGSLLTAGYVFLMLRYAFKPRGGEVVLQPVPRVMKIVPLLLAIAAVLLGFSVEAPLQLLRIGAPFSAPGTEVVVP
jgi:multicomponent Na+:H+ antiporter subunit D